VDVALWISGVVLALVHALAGGVKVMRTRQQLEPHMAWVAHASDAKVKTIGALEFAAAAGLVLPGATGIAEVLTPLAALALVALHLGALVNNRRSEPGRVPLNLVIIALAAFVALGRLGPYPL
jgi:hypothetical protein